MDSMLQAAPAHDQFWNTTYRGFRAQRFYLNLFPVLEYLHHSTDLDKPVHDSTFVHYNISLYKYLSLQ